MPKGMIDSLTLNEQCFSYDHDEKTKDQVTRTPLKTGGELNSNYFNC
jgi:hypothetical protein